jgi:hypothetical protein
MALTLADFKDRGYTYGYLGTCYTERALYKTRFPGMEFFNGWGWSADRRELHFLVQRDERTPARHLLETDDYTTFFLPMGSRERWSEPRASCGAIDDDPDRLVTSVSQPEGRIRPIRSRGAFGLSVVLAHLVRGSSCSPRARLPTRSRVSISLRTSSERLGSARDRQSSPACGSQARPIDVGSEARTPAFRRPTPRSGASPRTTRSSPMRWTALTMRMLAHRSGSLESGRGWRGQCGSWACARCR